MTIGDHQYADGASSEFLGSYDLSWGRFKAITRPIPGNHEYHTANAAGYFAYFGAAAGPSGLGYYSYDLGVWHLIALNSQVSHTTGSPQLQWLALDLAQNTRPCILAYWHYPRFSSGHHGNIADTAPFWQALYAARADIVLNAHDHSYERFDLQDPEGVVDSLGIREFVVGTGGRSLDQLGRRQPNSQVFHAGTYGVLKLTLQDASHRPPPEAAAWNL